MKGPIPSRFDLTTHLSQDIEVPETLLKKRKQNEKAREERLAAAIAARKVRPSPLGNPAFSSFHDAYCSTNRG